MKMGHQVDMLDRLGIPLVQGRRLVEGKLERE